ncbi:MAG: ferredoxin [Thermoproteota archaeon]|nr:MAG: ferredoxin [Candidatus Korarchaeota archaeon]
MPKVTIDRDACIACGVCASLCPDVFELDEEGKSSLVAQFRGSSPTEGEIPDDLADCARQAAENCPVQAISVG